MKKSLSKKNTGLLFIIGVIVTMILAVSLLFMREMKTLNEAYSDMNQIEFISSSTQRLISIAQSEVVLPKDVFFIGDSTKKALLPDSDSTISVLDDPNMTELATEVLASWDSIENLLKEDEINEVDLNLARDSHFKAMTDINSGIRDYTKVLNDNIVTYQSIITGLFFVLGVVVLNSMLNTHAELINSKKIADTAKIDNATGVFSRSVCQTIFEGNNPIPKEQNVGIVILDLNDLKKTNDTLGHRAGDDLISSFAKILKISTKIDSVVPFIGRYGGDEFIIYYKGLNSEEQITNYLDELATQTNDFNQEEKRFKISYAQGYAFVIENDNETLTIKQLFDKADENMYENKIAGKKARALEE